MVHPRTSPTELRVGLLADGFIGWGGGVDFIRLLLRGLGVTPHDRPIRVYLLCAREQVFGSRVRIVFYKLLRRLYRMLRGLPQVDFLRVSEDLLKDAFGDLVEKENRVLYSGTDEDLKAVCDRYHIDIVLPAIRPLPQSFPLPWVGYIFDFQHKYLPQFFSKKERRNRDRAFRRMLQAAKHVMVNARAVAEDCRTYFPHSRSKLHTLPFTPICFSKRENLPEFQALRSKYGLQETFFLISNQFWVHKDHETALRAFGQAFAGKKHVMLVCTGHPHDARAPDLLGRLEALKLELGVQEQVKFLGRIPKAEQLQLMKQAVAVIQPTLFEGAPGGGQVFEALALGKPVIVSDLPVNRELEGGEVEFFPPRDARALAELLPQYLTSEKSRSSFVDETQLEKKESALLENLNQFLTQVLKQALE